MIELDVTLTLRSPLSIGSGMQQGTLAQRGLLKEKDGWPFIPATTLKGNLRHAVEQLAAARGLPLVDPHSPAARDGSDPVTRLFGAPWVPGGVRFVDLVLTGPQWAVDQRLARDSQRPTTTQRTSVAINRRRKVAAHQRLFNTELFWPGAPLSFGGTLSGSLSRADAALLLAGVRFLVAVGRSRTAGLGWVQADGVVKEDGVPLSAGDLLAAVKELWS